MKIEVQISFKMDEKLMSHLNEIHSNIMSRFQIVTEEAIPQLKKKIDQIEKNNAEEREERIDMMKNVKNNIENIENIASKVTVNEQTQQE